MRLGINIPSDLYKRMAPLKGTVNISQICRSAIEAYVEAHERAVAMASETDDMTDAIDRLAEPEIVVDWEGIGLADGKAWIEMAKREHLEHLVHIMEVIEKQGRPPTDVCVPYLPGIKGYRQHASDYQDWFMQQSEIGGRTNPYIEAEKEYMRGWLAYVNVVLEQLRVHNQDARQDRLRELIAIRPSASEAELPGQLL